MQHTPREPPAVMYITMSKPRRQEREDQRVSGQALMSNFNVGWINMTCNSSQLELSQTVTRHAIRCPPTPAPAPQLIPEMELIAPLQVQWKNCSSLLCWIMLLLVS